ncbi:hypothetical protein HELRODRAFT_123115, partial [Helobdella robusta]|uniref:Peptidase M14 domain-containing protein n=1 Tax=Helobdella robusta TaxID=6412 RepID=T1EGW9_HELRO
DRPVIFIDAGFHAREWIAPVTAINFISKLVNTSDPVMNFLTLQYEFYILPLANPDGYEYSWIKDRLWRKTRSRYDDSTICLGTDLNRNWDFFWAGEGTSKNVCRENYCGPNAFSEPEARAIASFILSKSANMIVYLSFHSYGQLFLAPWGYTTKVPADFYDMVSLQRTEAIEAIRKTTGAKYNVGSTGRILYLASGASDDWVKGVAGVKYSYTLELRDTGTHGFLLPESEIQETALE